MANLVFFRTPEGPKSSAEFLAAVTELFRKALAPWVKELEETGQVTEGRCIRVSGGDWSVWIEDEAGERHCFRFYISELEESSHKRLRPSSSRGLGSWVSAPGRAGEQEWIEASSFIKSRFAGRVRDQLLEKLERASRGLPLFDGTIEFVKSGVILRALSQDTQVKKFDAEVEFVWSDLAGL